MTEETIFATALDKQTQAERSAFLDEACGSDTALRQRVVALLAAHEQAADFLEKPVVEQMAASGSPSNGPTQAVQAIMPAVEGITGTPPAALLGETQAEPPHDGDDGPSLDFLAPSEKPDALGRLNHYHVLAVIGRGGMGVVLKAFDEELQRVVAIKVMAPHVATTGTARKRFRREAQAAAAVRDEHVIDIHAVEEVNDLPYLVMEYVSGISLQDRIDQSGPLELKEILRIGMQTATGLAKAHAQGLIHRDIKPANILLENGVQRVKITDFGLARAVDDASLTQSGVIAGTPQYMAPEQARGEAVDHRADLFSLGSVLYAMCTGNPPFRASSTMAVLKRVCDDTPRPVREMNPDIPDWLCAIIDKLQAKDPAQRFSSAQEVADLLGQHLLHLQQPDAAPLPAPVVRPAIPRPHKRSSVWPWVLAAACVVCLVCCVVSVPALAMLGLLVGNVEVQPQPVAEPAERLEPEEMPPIAVPAEPARAPDPQAAAKPAGIRPIVILPRGGKAERSFATLAEAVAAAGSGDTIEIHGDGPFVSAPVFIRKALTIRAGKGFRPVIELSPAQAKDATPLLDTSAPLILEGLQLRRIGSDRPQAGAVSRMVLARKAGIRAANCRFVAFPDCVAVWADWSPLCEFRNCEFLKEGLFSNVDYFLPRGGRLILENNVMLGPDFGAAFHYAQADLDDATIEITHNTLVVETPIGVFLDIPLAPLAPGTDPPAKPIRVKAIGNLLDGRVQVVELFQSVDFLAKEKPLDTDKAQAVLRRLVAWEEQSNVYPQMIPLLGTFVNFPSRPLPAGKSLADWNRFWGVRDTASLQGKIRYRGSDLRSRPLAQLEQVTPEEFRLQADSPGHRAGQDGRDIGANVDLVGPGAAYERWKKTPAYQRWLKDTKQAEGGKP